MQQQHHQHSTKVVAAAAQLEIGGNWVTKAGSAATYARVKFVVVKKA